MCTWAGNMSYTFHLFRDISLEVKVGSCQLLDRPYPSNTGCMWLIDYCSMLTCQQHTLQRAADVLKLIDFYFLHYTFLVYHSWARHVSPCPDYWWQQVIDRSVTEYRHITCNGHQSPGCEQLSLNPSKNDLFPYKGIWMLSKSGLSLNQSPG